MKLSFGMIFSIFLIIIFIAFAFYAINKFLNLQRTLQIETFAKDLQNDVDSMWNSPKGEHPKEYSLPNKIIEVCFTNNEFYNLILKSSKFIDEKNIKHLDISKITANEDPYCIQNIDGKIKLILNKGFNEDLVTIIRNE